MLLLVALAVACVVVADAVSVVVGVAVFVDVAGVVVSTVDIAVVDIVVTAVAFVIVVGGVEVVVDVVVLGRRVSLVRSGGATQSSSSGGALGTRVSVSGGMILLMDKADPQRIASGKLREWL